jgi:hypothetical protein
VKLVWFDKADDVINYLNSGQPRARRRSRAFEFFGTRNRPCWMFDYSSNLGQRLEMLAARERSEENQPRHLYRKRFIKSWSCHTGESMNKKFYSATGARMWGATGKTQYMTDELPCLSTKGGRWTRYRRAWPFVSAPRISPRGCLRIVNEQVATITGILREDVLKVRARRTFIVLAPA